MSEAVRKICSLCPVIPVMVIEDEADAVPLARALVAGGLRVLEITLRTPAAFSAIERIRTEVCEAVVGAGTVLTPQDVEKVSALKVAFAVSPGTTGPLIEAVRANNLPFLPGAATASEAMRLMEAGFDVLKFFPAEAAGGIAMLKSLAAPLPGIGFCPTGGIGITNAPDYLKLSNVLCVGGSWVVPQGAVLAKDWSEITALARQASAL